MKQANCVLAQKSHQNRAPIATPGEELLSAAINASKASQPIHYYEKHASKTGTEPDTNQIRMKPLPILYHFLFTLY
jgi:hypothetical protein